MIKRLLRGALVSSALTLDQALRPAAVADLRGMAAGVVDQAEDGYEGVVRGASGFQPAAAVREDVWVHTAARPGEVRRGKHEIFQDEQVARLGVAALERETRAAWHGARRRDREHYETQDMSPEAMAERYGPDWREL